MAQEQMMGIDDREPQGTAGWYAAALEKVRVEREELKRLDQVFSRGRGILFFASLILLVLGAVSSSREGWGGAILWWSGWVALALFVIVVTIHEQRRAHIEVLRNRRSVLRRLEARLQRNWDRLPKWEPRPSDLPPVHPSRRDVADDLDLFGDGSLMQLVSVAWTGPGQRTLAQWLVEAADPEVASARATAAKRLVGDRGKRLRFYELARQASLSAAEPDAFVAWATGPRWLENRRWLLMVAWVLPIIAILLFVIGGAFGGSGEEGVVHFDWGRALLLGAIPLVLQLVLTVWSSGPIHRIFAAAVNRRSDLEGYLEMFAQAAALPGGPEMPGGPEIIGHLKRRLVEPTHGALSGMGDLGRIARWIAARRGGISYLLFLVLQILILWDVHLLARLETWQRRFGKDAKDWFAALGQLEALQSLAALYDDYPQWATPEWVQVNEEAVLAGTQVAHPLLRDDVRVGNDVQIGPPGTLLLVTGSNMSGKSTMLRSVGLNVVLAAAGGPVCARMFRLPAVELATSIRVRDSLKEGVSFYMAELHRLRDVVGQARVRKKEPRFKTLYLLDEILQGTNSRERAIAVVQVLRHLLDSGAIGAISTHDLELAEDPQLVACAQVVHFRETIECDAGGKETMRFDYLMRPGVTPTTNALRLLALVGLGKDMPDTERSGAGKISEPS